MELTQTVEPTLETILAPLLIQRQQLKEWVASHEKEIDALNDQIKTALVQNGQTEAVAAGHKVTLNLEAEKSTLDKQRLMELGVTTEQIQKAMKTTTFVKLDVRKAKEKE